MAMVVSGVAGGRRPPRVWVREILSPAEAKAEATSRSAPVRREATATITSRTRISTEAEYLRVANHFTPTGRPLGSPRRGE